MDNPTDTYKTIVEPSAEILFKEKKSKFYGYAFPIANETEVKPIIEKLRKKHHTANHVCYAWQIGVVNPYYRANDDGEPNNSAGMPIYGQIQSFDLTNVLVAVVRIFGGTKLGVGGLISAYRMGAQMALDECSIVERTLKAFVQLSFGYPEMDRVMRIIKKHQLEISSQQMEMNCSLTLTVRRNDVEKVLNLFSGMKNVVVKKIATS